MNDEIKSLMNHAESIFNDIEVAEEIIATYTRNGYQDKLNKNFMLFMRSDYVTTEYLYRQHCEEMAFRITRDIDTRPATNAELLNLTSNASSQTKFNADGTLVFDYLYSRVTGKESPAHGIYPQPYQGYTEKLIEELRKKYTISERTLAL